MESVPDLTIPDQATRWLGERRWYGDKGRDIRELAMTFGAEATVNSRAVRIELIRIAYVTGPPSTYLLVRGHGDSGVSDRDCIEDADVRTWLMEGFQVDREVEGTDGVLRWSGSDELRSVSDGIRESSRVFRGEQSNTSIIYGEQVMLKLFRKIQPGRNPEVEIGEFLTGQTDFDAFPRMLGTIDLVRGDESTTIACVQQFIASKGDAWTWMLDELTSAGGAEGVADAPVVLGQRTAGLHAALALGTSPAFVPELFNVAETESVHDAAVRELEQTIALLSEHGVSDVGRLRDALAPRLADLRLLTGTYRTRIHGDYHLGQVLRTNRGDFAILDFEGEPTRSLQERREKASPLRDVAGMLRSLDYLAEAARRRSPDASADAFVSWSESARQAFIAGYTTTAQGSPTLARGLDPDTWKRVVAAFEVHKALYEARYEVGNRPDWIDIPMQGLWRLAGTAG